MGLDNRATSRGGRDDLVPLDASRGSGGGSTRHGLGGGLWNGAH